MKHLFCFWVSLLLFSTLGAQNNRILLDERLILTSLTEHAYLHTSFLSVKEYGLVPCNGVVYVAGGEAVVFDTPVNDTLSRLLISWLEDSLKVSIKAVVINHFHDDCLGGLKAFQQINVPSYAYAGGLKLAAKNGSVVPGHGFKKSMELEAGTTKIICRYFGEAHAPDNITCWIPDEKLLFGGCMIKSLEAGKGNLSDANINSWATTVKKVKAAYPDAGIVVPGHGETGGVELLDYTIQLFSK